MATTPGSVVVSGESGHRYFHQMLNMAEDELDPFEYRILGHYVRRAGHGGGDEVGHAPQDVHVALAGGGDLLPQEEVTRKDTKNA